MAQRRYEELLRCPGDGRIAGFDVIRKDVVTDIEFGDVDIHAEASQRVQEFAESTRVVRIFRVQTPLTADDIELHARMLEIGDQLQQPAANRKPKLVVAFGLRLVQHEFGGAIDPRGAFECAPYVVGAAGVGPGADPESAGRVMPGPKWLVDDVP